MEIGVQLRLSSECHEVMMVINSLSVCVCVCVCVSESELQDVIKIHKVIIVISKMLES